MARVPIAVQLYSVREDCARDFAGTMAAVAEMGYEGVEFAGFHDHTAEQVRKMLDDTGLKVAGAHISLDQLLGDAFEATVEFHATIGNRYLIVPWIPEQYRESAEAWKRTAELFNELAEKLKPHGMRIGYHNHHVEFQPLDGACGWEIFFDNTVPEVIMQIDTGNAVHGGADPVAYVRKYPGRAVTVHVKEYSASNDKALVGEGDIDWAAFFEACETVGGTEWYIVEQETYAYPPLECVRRCLENLRKMGK